MPTDAATQRLLDDLRAKPDCFDQRELVRAAERLRFHDYKSQHETPKFLLIQRLLRAGYTDLAALAKSGRYDQGREESSEWAQTEEAQLARDAIAGKVGATEAEASAVLDESFGSVRGMSDTDIEVMALSLLKPRT